MALPQEKLNRQRQAAKPQPVDQTKEYVSGAGFWSTKVGSILSAFWDDVDRVLGLDTYERMANDPVISKDIRYQKISTLADGVQVYPAVNDKDPEFETAKEIADFCHRCFEGLQRPLAETLDDLMTAAFKRAHGVAEITYNEPAAMGVDAYKLTLKSIKVKPRNATAFVVDPFLNVIGFTAWSYGGDSVAPAAKLDGQMIIPREKFAVLTYETQDEDPRGVNQLRPAANYWQGKNLVPALHLKWLEKSGIPSTIGITAPNEPAYQQPFDNDLPATDAQGNAVVQTASEIMASRLADLESASSAAFAHGADVKVLQVAGDGSQFSRGYEEFDRQMDYALLLQSGATKDAKYGNRSAKQILKDIVDLLIWARKTKVASMLRHDVLRGVVEVNFGADKLHLTPFISLGDTERKDWATDAKAATEIGPYVPDSIWASMVRQLGLEDKEENEVWPARTRKKEASQGPNAGEGDDAVGAMDSDTGEEDEE
ncbi:MAG TPA: hypothetical protein VF708_19945 [Pyrinomonadaceae bacterium]